MSNDNNLSDDDVRRILEERIKDNSKKDEDFFTRIFRMQKESHIKAHEKLILREKCVIF